MKDQFIVTLASTGLTVLWYAQHKWTSSQWWYYSFDMWSSVRKVLYFHYKQQRYSCTCRGYFLTSLWWLNCTDTQVHMNLIGDWCKKRLGWAHSSETRFTQLLLYWNCCLVAKTRNENQMQPRKKHGYQQHTFYTMSLPSKFVLWIY